MKYKEISIADLKAIMDYCEDEMKENYSIANCYTINKEKHLEYQTIAEAYLKKYHQAEEELKRRLQS